MANTQESGTGRATRRQVIAVAAAGGAATLAGVAASRAGVAAALSSEPLVGSWLCVYSRSTGETLTGLLTFHENGTVINATSDHLTGGTSHGTWNNLGNGQYAYSVLRLDVDSAGNYSGVRSVDADLAIDPSGKSWTSTSRTSFYDTSGALSRDLTSAATATRIPLVRRTDPRPQNIISMAGGQ